MIFLKLGLIAVWAWVETKHVLTIPKGPNGYFKALLESKDGKGRKTYPTASKSL